MLHLHHDGSSESIAWVVGRLKEMALHACAHPAKAVARDRVNASDPAGRVHLRFSCTGRTAWMTGAIYRSWDRQWRIRLVHRRSSSPPFILDCVMPRRGLSTMARDLTTVILDSAIQLSSARIHGDPISDHPPHCLHAMTVQAKAIENGAERLWIQAADPWNRPRVFVRDGNGGLLPVTLTPEGREAVPAAERRMVLRIGSDGVYEFDVAHWSGACAEDDPVEAMRSFARNPLPLCHNHRG